MKVTYKDIPNTYYNESPQNNPIRWVVLAKVGEDVYESTTMPFKCKDYFNDFVIYKHTGDEFCVHGMKSSQAKFCERGGLYVLVYGTKPEFAQNVQNVLQLIFKDVWDASVEVTPINRIDVDGLPQNDGFAILWFSPECLVSTFRISVLTLLIRNCNVPFVVLNYDERIDMNLIHDGGLNYVAYLTLKERNFTFPEQAEYVWYCDEEYNSKKRRSNSYILHNNGMLSWIEASIFPDKYNRGWLDRVHTLGPLILGEDEEEHEWDDEEEEV